MNEVDALHQAIDDHGLRLSLASDAAGFRVPTWRLVHWVDAAGTEILVPVDDEFGDGPDAGPALLLQLVLGTCECYEECEDILEWAVETELDASDPAVLELYRALGAVVPVVRSRVGTEIRAISSWDFSTNAGAAARLRGS